MNIYWYRNTAFYRENRREIAFYNYLLSIFSTVCLCLFLIGDQSDVIKNHRALSHDIRSMAIVTGLHTGVFAVDDRVLQAMAQVPRHQFISRPYHRFAYTNIALPAQDREYMIPEPFITAMMVHLLDLDKTDIVLDIGFGTGYDAAVISRIARTVYAIEQTPPLEQGTIFQSAEDKGFNNVVTSAGNGVNGLTAKGPFDAILVRQSLSHLPQALIDQLKPGGRLVAPIGFAGNTQRLMVYTKNNSNKIHKKSTLYLQVAPLLKGREI